MPQPRSQVPDGAIQAGYNNSGSTIVAKRAVQALGAGADQIQLPASGAVPTFGFTMQDIPTGTRGDVQVAGMAIGTSAAAITRGAELQVDTAGKVLTRTTGASVGFANTTVGAADLDVEVRCNLPSSADGT